MTRRTLLKQAAYSAVISTALSASRVLGANERIRLALLGAHLAGGQPVLFAAVLDR